MPCACWLSILGIAARSINDNQVQQLPTRHPISLLDRRSTPCSISTSRRSLRVGTLVAPDPQFTRTASSGNERWKLHLGNREAAATRRKAPNSYSRKQSKCLAAKPPSVALPRTRSGVQSDQLQSYCSAPSRGVFCWFWWILDFNLVQPELLTRSS
jgi:hypothetical protein